MSNKELIDLAILEYGEGSQGAFIVWALTHRMSRRRIRECAHISESVLERRIGYIHIRLRMSLRLRTNVHERGLASKENSMARPLYNRMNINVMRELKLSPLMTKLR